MASKMHLLDTTTTPSRSHPEWVKHTQTLCGIEFHLGSDYLASVELNPDFRHVTCKRCLKKYDSQVKPG